MATPVSELQKINPSNIIELFQLQLDTTIHGANTTYYFHNGVSENNKLYLHHELRNLAVVEKAQQYY